MRQEREREISSLATQLHSPVVFRTGNVLTDTDKSPSLSLQDWFSIPPILRAISRSTLLTFVDFVQLLLLTPNMSHVMKTRQETSCCWKIFQ